MAKLIGITGLARAGKDTLAREFMRRGYHRYAFADALKIATAYIANEQTHLYFDEVAKEQYTEALEMTRRRALQDVGNGLRNALGDKVWVRRVLREWHAAGNHPAVISDVRYDNEAQAIKELGGVVVRVLRDGSGLTGDAAKHVSEAGVADALVDFEVYNNGTIAELGAEANKIHSHLVMGLV